MHKENLRRRFGITFGDFAVFLMLITVFSIVFFKQYSNKEQTSFFVVKADHKTIILRPELNKDLYVESSGYHYVIRVKNGTIMVYKADCPDKLCIKMGRISLAGERIICIPGRLVITAEGKQKYDAINR